MEKQIDMMFLKPFIDGVIHTVSVQFRVDINYEKPFLKTKDEKFKIDIAGIISVFSSNFNGTICICFPEKTFLNFMEKMLDEKYDKITDEVADGAAEFTNTVYGYAKKILNDKGNDLQKAIPNTVMAEDLKLSQLQQDPVIILPFKTPLGDFQMRIGITLK